MLCLYIVCWSLFCSVLWNVWRKKQLMNDLGMSVLFRCICEGVFLFRFYKNWSLFYLASGAREMNRFGYRMSTAMFNSLADKHLWISLLNRPAQSRFTRVQRATCCVTILFIFIAVNAMWYGLLKKSNTELSWEGFGWEEIVLGLVSNVVVLPFSVGLVFLFKKSRQKVCLSKFNFLF